MTRPITRLLVHSYACHPHEGSEPGAGWQVVASGLELAEHVTLFTRANNVKAVADGIRQLPPDDQARIEVIGFDLSSPWLKAKKAIPGGTQIYYLLWQGLAASRIRALHETSKYDLAIHATFAVDWLPTALQWVRGLDYIWGPVGGSTRIPLRLYRFLGVRGTVAELARRVVGGAMRKSFARCAPRRSRIVLVQNQDVLPRFQNIARSVVLPNAAPLVPPRAELECRRSSTELIAVGRLLPLKGLAVAIQAITAPECEGLTLTIYGEGPDERRLRRMAARLGAADRVRFMGKVPRAQVLSAMGSARALVFPSFHDSSPWTVAEALALACPVVALDLAGPATLLKGANVDQVSHRAPDLVARFAAQMAEPPEPGAVDCWTPRAFTARLRAVVELVKEPESPLRVGETEPPTPIDVVALWVKRAR